MSENGRPPQQVPVTPWEIWWRDGGFDFEPLPDGSMLICFLPGVPSPQGGMALMPPAIKVVLSAEGWRKFQARVAMDGRPLPEIPIARTMPKP